MRTFGWNERHEFEVYIQHRLRTHRRLQARDTEKRTAAIFDETVDGLLKHQIPAPPAKQMELEVTT